jgi:DNA-directed RNA polymerase subunit RPC12/RpoP
MAQVNAKCTNCNQEIIIDDQKDADICPYCNKAFVSEKAIKLYKLDSEEEKQVRVIRKRHMFKSFLMGFWMVFKCILYLFYVLLCLWLFFDIVDDIKKK